MRRKSDKQIKKEFISVLIFGIVAIFESLFVLTYPLIPATPLEEHKEKEIVILQFDFHAGGRYGASYHYIITEDGEKYNITGEYNAPELYELLTEGTVTTIMYDTNKILPWKKYAEEMTVDGNKIVTYNNDDPTNWTAHIIFGALTLLAGAGLLFLYRWEILHNREVQAKRDSRIIKKYGRIKK